MYLYCKLLYNNILTISKYQKGYIGDLIKRAGNFYLPPFFLFRVILNKFPFCVGRYQCYLKCI